MLEIITDEQLAENGVVSAPDKLVGDPEENKKIFDRLIVGVLAPHINRIVEAYNKLESDLKNHVDIDPSSVRDNNVSVTEAVKAALELEGVNPTVKDALLALERLAGLKPEVAQLLSLEASATQNDAIEFLAKHCKMESGTLDMLGLHRGATIDDVVERLWGTILNPGGQAYILIRGTYAETDRPAKGLRFSGGISGELGADGTYFSSCSAGEITISFERCLGSAPIEDISVAVEGGAITTVDVVLEKDDSLVAIDRSGDYFVGENAARAKVLAVGGGGSGGTVGYIVNSNSYKMGAASGGNGGYIEETELDLTDYVGRRLTVLIGAGGDGKVRTSDYSWNGTPGGETSITSPEGAVLVRASGGEGGKGVYAAGEDGSDRSFTITAENDGADRQGKGVGGYVRRDGKNISYAYGFTGEENADGIFVFDNSDGIAVGAGGCARIVYTEKASGVSTRVYKSDAGAADAGVDGTGAGGGANIESDSTVAVLRGGSGAVYVQVVS